MTKLRISWLIFFFCAFSLAGVSADLPDYDVLVIGGGTSGTAAAIQAARSGSNVLLVEEGEWLGGMLTSAGVSATDGCYKLKGGIWGEFRDSLEAYYGGAEALKSGWVSNVMFEPSVGARIFRNMSYNESNLDVRYRSSAVSFEKYSDGWKVGIESNGEISEITGRILIDATELGDVAKAIGIPYSIGMDSRHETNEDIAPEESNGIIQDLTYVMILQDYGHPVPIPEPDGYSPSEFACCCANPNCVNPKEKDRIWSPEEMISYGKLQNGKFMINWPIEGNDTYCDVTEMSVQEREQALQEAKDRSIRFLYFIQNELGMKNLGMSEEYPTSDGFPFIPYYRESRRIEGKVRFCLNDITAPYEQTKKLYRTSVAVGDYPVDQHHTRYHGWEELPNLYFHAVPSYGLPAGVMIPEKYDNVLVIEKSISVTNIVNGTTRLQPVVLQLGQAAGVMASQAVKAGGRVSKVSLRSVQKELLDNGAYLLPLLDLPADSPYFKPMQRVALTGIMRFEGKTEGWENQMWFNADRTVSETDLLNGFREFYNGLACPSGDRISFSGLSDAKDDAADVSFLSSLVSSVIEIGQTDAESAVISVLRDKFNRTYTDNTTLTRLECAVAIDSVLSPFEKYDVDIYGNLKASPEKLMWIDLSANWERFHTIDSVRFYCEKIARTGMTSIVLDVKGTGSDVPYVSAYTPQLEECKGVKAPDFDYIEEFSKAARANGLKIYCSINTFAEGHGIFKKGLIYDGHPEWQAVNYVPGKGIVRQVDIEGKTVLFTNPALPEVRRHICGILSELVSRFDIDGVILDRGRYDNIQSDFSDFSRSQFEKYIGRKVKNFPEDIYEWIQDGKTGNYEIKRGKYFKKWIEWRASVIYSFFEEARAAVKTSNPDAVFGAYTGAWYPSYYEVGVNWASKKYNPASDFDWATRKYRHFGYAELLDLYTNGNYYPLVTLDEFRKSNGTYRNETDSSISTGEHLCVEGACLYSRMLLGDNPFLGGLYVDDYKNNPEQFKKSVKMNLDRSDGLMIFDLVHIVNNGWWKYLEDAIRNN